MDGKLGPLQVVFFPYFFFRHILAASMLQCGSPIALASGNILIYLRYRYLDTQRHINIHIEFKEIHTQII